MRYYQRTPGRRTTGRVLNWRNAMSCSIRLGQPFARASLAAAALLLTVPAASAQSEGSFERSLSVTGAVQLSIRTGSGRIRVQPGSGGTVRITARLRAGTSWFSGDASDRIRQIEKNPPVEQNGNSIRVGYFADERLARNISISYDVTVPAETTLNARTGSGGVDIGDLRGAVDASTGSGSIEIGRIAGRVTVRTGSGGITVAGAQGLEARSGSGSITAAEIAGPVVADTGSGSLRIAQSGKGDVDASSSSGEVVVTGVDGAARVSASSGSIVVDGRPTAPWNIHSSSGRVTLRIPQDAAFEIDARASSGRIESSHPVTVSGRIDRQRLQGQVRGGGPLVAVRCSSGGIRIQ
jgi:hypothetical protein